MSAITYKPVSERVYGLATIKVGDKACKITWNNGEEVISKKVSLNDLPDVPVLKKGTEKAYYVVYNSSTGEVESIGPERGMFQARCVDMSRPEEGADPEPIAGQTYKDKKTNKENQSYYFKVWFRIEDKTYAGVRIPYNLGYKLQGAPDGTTVFTSDPSNPKATAVRKLAEFLDVTGVLEGEPILWEENDGNVLPEILSRILRAKRNINIVVKEGKITELLERDDDYEVDDEFSEEKFFGDDEEQEEEPVSKPKKSEKQNMKELGFGDEDDLDKEFPKRSPKSANDEDDEEL